MVPTAYRQPVSQVVRSDTEGFAGPLNVVVRSLQSLGVLRNVTT